MNKLFGARYRIGEMIGTGGMADVISEKIPGFREKSP
jgi:hypothetical protein